MAKIKFGMMMTDARGKLGGQVFSKNRSGSYVRTKVTPVNPRTQFQQENRSLLGSLSGLWSGLTENERRAWNSQVESWQKTNVFGDLQKPSGKNLFTGLNKNRLNLFPVLAVLTDPPAKVDLPVISIQSVTFSLNETGLAITLVVPAEASVNVRVRATPPVSSGTTYVNNLLRQVGVNFVVPSNGILNVNTAYGSRFGFPVAGQKIFVEVTPVATNGQIGVPTIAEVFVTA